MSSWVQSGRRRVEITRPDKQLFPCGISKTDLASYYERVAEAMLPHLARRPLNLERYPDGIEGERIVQQRAGGHFPGWITRATVPKKDGSVEHVVAGNAATLVYLAGQACITLHPWLSRADALDRPDRLIFDLDPSEDKPAETRKAAKLMAAVLRELELEPFVMTTGSRGFHLTVPLQRRAEYDAVREFARHVAELASRRHPGLFTTEQRKAKRENRILIDVMRNAYAHTSVAPYAVRARRAAPVAAPLHFAELDDRATRADRFTLRSMPERLERDGDPWAEIGSRGQTLTNARRRLAEALAEAR